MKSFELFSPTDYRYYVKESNDYLSEEAYIRYKGKVELALVKLLEREGLCPKGTANELERVLPTITVEQVEREERRTKHDVRALVNALQDKMKVGKNFVHLTATSYDIVDTANVLRYRDVTNAVILPEMARLERTLINLALEEMDTLQIARTHGQYAVPITFGFALASYVDRWGERLCAVKSAADNLKGKFSGAVGAYNASSLLLADPEKGERELLGLLGLEPERISTQIVAGDAKADYAHSMTSAFSVLANLADDLRQLQRSEISEVYEQFGKEQVGSSTMPQKRNPISFENVKSLYKAFLPRMLTIYLDQISEHQRDLTNSASQRFIPELLNCFTYCVKRMNRALTRLKVDRERMREKIDDTVLAEPLYILLSYYGFENAHEYVRELAQRARNQKRSLSAIAFSDKKLARYIAGFTDEQKAIISEPSRYTGRASKKTRAVCEFWQAELKGKGLW